MLTLRCTLLREVFEGGAPDDPRTAEWPPSWMRLFSALVSVAAPETADDDLLRALEEAPPPLIHAAPARRVRRAAFVPTNAIQAETKHTTLPGRTNGERIWARAVPQSPEIWYRWPALTFHRDQEQRLVSLCRKIPYLGRSTSPALVEVTDGPGPEGEWLEPLVDVPPTYDAVLATSVRSPFPGSLGALRAAYDERFRLGEAGDPWQIGQGVDYGRLVERQDGTAIDSPYSSMVVLRWCGRKLDGRHTARATNALRRTLLARAAQHIAPLHGHHDGNVVQVAFLGLLDAGHDHADGHLLGLAVALPVLQREQLAVIADALPDPGQQIEVTAGPLGVLTLERISPLDAQRTARGLRPERWSAVGRTWVSVTPVVLDRFAHRDEDLADEIRRAALNAQLPAPRVLEISRRPLLRGVPRFTPADTLRRPSDTVIKPYLHVKLEFPEPVRGPVLLGSMRHYGLGLCAPTTDGSVDDG